MSLGAIGQVPNNTTFQGIIKQAIVEGITTSTWNPRSGGTSKTIFEGNQAQVTDLAQQSQAAGYEYSIVGGATWKLEVTIPWDIIVNGTEGESDPLFVWEMVNTSYQRDILECTDRPFNYTLTQLSKDKIAAKLKAPVGNTITPFDINETEENIINATVLYNLKRIGVNGRAASLQTLRKTMIVSNNFIRKSSLIDPTSDFKIFTKTQLLAKYNDTEPILSQIPDVIINALPSFILLTPWDSKTPIATTGYSMDYNGIVTFVGYLQMPAEYQMISLQKVQITQNWVFNQWSAGPWGLYDPVDTSLQSPDPNWTLSLII
jgi:hypothetical protein